MESEWQDIQVSKKTKLYNTKLVVDARHRTVIIIVGTSGRLATAEEFVARRRSRTIHLQPPRRGRGDTIAENLIVARAGRTAPISQG